MSLLFCAPASPRGRRQRSGAVGEEEGEPQTAGGAEDSDQTVRGGETPQRDGARQVNTVGTRV